MFSNFWNSAIGKIIIGLVIGAIVTTIGWFIKYDLDKSHGLIQPTQVKIPENPVKKL